MRLLLLIQYIVGKYADGCVTLDVLDDHVQSFVGLGFTSSQAPSESTSRFSLKWFTSNFWGPLVNIHKLASIPFLMGHLTTTQKFARKIWKNVH